MRNARIVVSGVFAGILEETDDTTYQFTYNENYSGQPVSLTMPLTKRMYVFDRFPPFFEGLLPEGIMLEALLRKYKLDKNDYFGQLLRVGMDVVGNVTVEAIK